MKLTKREQERYFNLRLVVSDKTAQGIIASERKEAEKKKSQGKKPRGKQQGVAGTTGDSKEAPPNDGKAAGEG